MSRPASPEERLARLRDSAAGCSRCGLHKARTNVVFGTGSPRARLVFVGEGPGRDEDLQGEPFVGAAGQLLNKIIQAIGLEREQTYICNVVKCRPPGNRVPDPTERDACGTFLAEQLRAISPEVIVCLGATAADHLLQSEAPVARLRGRFHEWEGIPLMPTYHPAYLLRTPEAKRAVWEDMKKVRDKLASGGTAKG